MLDYARYGGLKDFYTIQDVCEAWGINKAELRAASEKYGFFLFKDQKTGAFGLPAYDFRLINNLLYFEQCRDGADDSQIWVSWLSGM